MPTNFQRRDLYGECNMDGAPVDAFTAECCMYCLNPECTRSSFGKSKFDIRVNSWYERLFSNVPRMTQDDPRFNGISAQKFLAINPSLTVNSKWIDPRDIPSTQESTKQVPIIPETKEICTQPKEGIPPSVVEQPKSQQPNTRDLALINTKAQQNQMLPHENIPKAVSSDPWQAPIPTTDTENVRIIKPGSQIKL